MMNPVSKTREWRMVLAKRVRRSLSGLKPKCHKVTSEEAEKAFQTERRANHKGRGTVLSRVRGERVWPEHSGQDKGGA